MKHHGPAKSIVKLFIYSEVNAMKFVCCLMKPLGALENKRTQNGEKFDCFCRKMQCVLRVTNWLSLVFVHSRQMRKHPNFLSIVAHTITIFHRHRLGMV